MFDFTEEYYIISLDFAKVLEALNIIDDINNFTYAFDLYYVKIGARL